MAGKAASVESLLSEGLDDRVVDALCRPTRTCAPGTLGTGVLQAWLDDTYDVDTIEIASITGATKSLVVPRRRPDIILPCGHRVSVQAGKGLYCTPRVDGAVRYTAVEVGYPNFVEPTWLDYAEEPDKPTDTVYAYVPIEIVEMALVKRGWWHVSPTNTK